MSIYLVFSVYLKARIPQFSKWQIFSHPRFLLFLLWYKKQISSVQYVNHEGSRPLVKLQIASLPLAGLSHDLHLTTVDCPVCVGVL